MGSPALRGQVAVGGERFDSPRWEGLWGWAECEAGAQEAGPELNRSESLAEAYMPVLMFFLFSH